MVRNMVSLWYNSAVYTILVLLVCCGTFSLTHTAPVSDAGRDACTQPKITGPCKAYFPSWFFNTETGKCEFFVYGGCHGNDNRFVTEQECNATCADVNIKKEEKPCAKLLSKSTHLIGSYIPKCTDDGYFKPTQCHGSIGVCWCVDKNGSKFGEPYDASQNCEDLVAKLGKGQ